MNNIKEKIYILCKKEYVCLSVIVLSGFLFRLFCAWQTPLPPRDSSFYLRYVECWNQSGINSIYDILIHDFGSTVWQPPLYMFLVHLLSTFGIFSISQAGIMISALTTSAAAIPVFMSARTLNSRIMSFPWLAALFFEVHPYSVSMGHSFLRDGIALFFIAWITYFLILVIKNGQLHACIWLGFFIAQGILTRYEIMEFFPLTIILLLISWWYKKRKLREICVIFSVITVSTLLFFILELSFITGVKSGLLLYKNIFIRIVTSLHAMI